MILLLILVLLLVLIVYTNSIKRSAILMPYNFGYDDTSKYILLMIKVLQDLDEKYHVDLLLCHGGTNHGHTYLKDGTYSSSSSLSSSTTLLSSTLSSSSSSSSSSSTSSSTTSSLSLPTTTSLPTSQ